MCLPAQRRRRQGSVCTGRKRCGQPQGGKGRSALDLARGWGHWGPWAPEFTAHLEIAALTSPESISFGKLPSSLVSLSFPCCVLTEKFL